MLGALKEPHIYTYIYIYIYIYIYTEREREYQPRGERVPTSSNKNLDAEEKESVHPRGTHLEAVEPLQRALFVTLLSHVSYLPVQGDFFDDFFSSCI